MVIDECVVETMKINDINVNWHITPLENVAPHSWLVVHVEGMEDVIALINGYSRLNRDNLIKFIYKTRGNIMNIQGINVCKMSFIKLCCHQNIID
jgi:hypothetical protein